MRDREEDLKPADVTVTSPRLPLSDRDNYAESRARMGSFLQSGRSDDRKSSSPCCIAHETTGVCGTPMGTPLCSEKTPHTVARSEAAVPRTAAGCREG